MKARSASAASARAVSAITAAEAASAAVSAAFAVAEAVSAAVSAAFAVAEAVSAVADAVFAVANACCASAWTVAMFAPLLPPVLLSKPVNKYSHSREMVPSGPTKAMGGRGILSCVKDVSLTSVFHYHDAAKSVAANLT
jgi:hypothetical protein